MSDPGSPPPRVRVRWGWILGCTVLGLTSITAGLLLAAPAERTGYLAGVLGGVGTTLLLVGFVVLLERRIVDTAVRVARRVADVEREASEARVERLVADLDARLSREWSGAGEEDVAELKRRTADLTDETVARIVAEVDRSRARRDGEAGG